MFINLLLKNYNAIICLITMQAYLESVGSELLKSFLDSITASLAFPTELRKTFHMY